MRIEANAAMFAYPLVAFILFAVIRPRRRAILAIVMLGYMFLPEAPGGEYKIPGLPAFSKTLNINISAMLAVIILDTRRLLAFRPRWADVPILVMCLIPFVTSMLNDLGIHDATSATIGQIMLWGFAYILGRIYFSRPQELRELAIAIFIGGVIYVPLCWIEIRMSPQLHTWVYGYQPSAFDQAIRFGGYRPVVFFMHGLVVGLWMAMATLVGFWLWLSGSLKSFGRFSILWFLIPLAITTVFVKSMGALILLCFGMGVALMTRYFAHQWILWAVAALPLLYIGLRASGAWSGEEMVAASNLVSDERGGSLEFRLQNEDRLAQKALQRPIFGWGGWGRSRVYDEYGRDISITDGLWILQLGYFGLVGLVAFLGIFLVPSAVVSRRIPAAMWTTPLGAPLAMLATVLVLWLIDCLPNATFNPVYLMGAGGLAGLTFQWKVATPAPARSRIANVPR